ncbi:MAG: hypothetical protein JWQ73_4364, partial [Variovorax sp.]|nr:hypothetical protein [Variovorax sp.]
MVQVPRRTGFSGSTLVRLLARLTDIDVTDSKRSFADRLSRWLGWTDAITLSSVLNGDISMEPAAAVRATRTGDEAECKRVRAALVVAINEDPTPARNAAAGKTTDFAPWRRRYIARQQAMETHIAALRKRVRATLAGRSPAMAQLAALDAVMEHALGAQEQRLLATVPGLLEKHFRRQVQAEKAERAVELAGAEDSEGKADDVAEAQAIEAGIAVRHGA